MTALLEKRRGTCAEATFDVAHTQLGHFTSYEVRPGLTIKEMRLDALDGDGELILDVLKQQAKRNYAADSIRLLRNEIKQLLDRALSQGYLVQHPLRDPDVLKDIRGLFKTIRESRPEKIKAMTAEQARHFLKTALEKSPLFAFFATGFGCGPRLEDLVALQPGDDVVRVIEGRRVRQLHICPSIPQRMSRKNPQPKQLKQGGTTTWTCRRSSGRSSTSTGTRPGKARGTSRRGTGPRTPTSTCRASSNAL